ncbi:hypothetical protein DVH24_008551 [Malus domestica]|uniref:Sulfotransferase n=1 Tax=Malus domestica TaxID=3750 RepID=A0A498JS24_MALDO|nr:hypothetical protein DVH24_008551 [Malus domestica]
MFATLNRSLYDAASPHHPLLTTGPHDCFPFLDMDDMLGNHDHNRPVTSLDHDHDDRDGGDGMINNYVPPTSTTQLFATHLPYSLLPKSVTTSSSTCSVSKFVYVYRNPKDVFISSWIFASKVRAINTRLAPFSLEEAFEIFCRGVCPYGPYWDHVLGFWKASLEMPEQVWFLKYEDLKKEPSANVKRLAEFLGQPFSEEEESKGVVQQIIKLCSFENLSSLEVNKTSRTQQYFVKANIVFENSDFFRKGQVGDWKNFFTDDMAKCMDQIVDERFSGSGLTFANPTSTKTCLRDADNFVAQSMFARRDAQDVAQAEFTPEDLDSRKRLLNIEVMAQTIRSCFEDQPWGKIVNISGTRRGVRRCLLSDNQLLREAMTGGCSIRAIWILNSLDAVVFSSESYSERPGVPNCVYYMRTGLCGYGGRCQYNQPRDRSAVDIKVSPGSHADEESDS